jgi:ribonuclease HII
MEGWLPVELDAAELARIEAMLEFERGAAAMGFVRIAGVDEAGRGPLAGPIVAGAVVLNGALAGLNDSKQLKEAQREALYAELLAGGHAIGCAVIEAEEIDRIGIQQANYAAMARAVAALVPPPDYVLVDGFQVPGLAQAQLRLIKGDARSLSIAAASIVAKVTRDRLMVAHDAAFPGYGFARHKGYGTAEHLAALARLGPCAIHRRSFAPLARGHETGVLL